MIKLKSTLMVAFMTIISSSIVFGQAEKAVNQVKQPTSIPDTRGYNSNSIRPIHESDIMYRRTIWRNVDLNEKQNQPFMAQNNEITRIIFDAVKSGKITPFTSDSLHTKMSFEQFQTNLADPNIQPLSKDEIDDQIRQVNQQVKDGWITRADGDKQIATIKSSASGAGSEMPAYRFSQLEIKEDLIFDKQRSRMYYDIQTITIWLPGSANKLTGIDKKIASFRFKDLAKYFKSNPNAIWFNALNHREHKNLTDAFELRLFSSMIIKISNPKDEDLATIYADKSVRPMVASKQKEYELMEFEHNLWEF